MGELKKSFPDSQGSVLGEHNVLLSPGSCITFVSVALCLLVMYFRNSGHLENCLNFIISVVLGVEASKGQLGGRRVLLSAGRLTFSLHLRK